MGGSFHHGGKAATGPSSPRWRFLACTAALVAVPLLSGCVALALAPLIPLVGGVTPGDNKVEIDQTTVTPELRNTMAQTKKLAVLSIGPSISHMAEVLDSKGAFDVTAEEPPKGATPSQRRTMAQEICAKKKPDIVIAPSTGTTDSGSAASNVGAMFLGRAIVDMKINTEVLRCRDGWRHTFTSTIKLNQGLWNTDRAKVDQVIGEEAAKSLMQLAGKQ